MAGTNTTVSTPSAENTSLALRPASSESTRTRIDHLSGGGQELGEAVGQGFPVTAKLRWHGLVEQSEVDRQLADARRTGPGTDCSQVGPRSILAHQHLWEAVRLTLIDNQPSRLG